MDDSNSRKGFVYILKDGHFPRGVKIGQTLDVEKRMRPMLTANPWLSVYVKVETSKWKELEKAVHNIIKLIAKKKQVKNSEFYMIEPGKAKKILLEFRPLFDKDDFIIHSGTGESESGAAGGLYELGIKCNDELVFIPTGVKVKVVGDKQIEYKGSQYSLSGFCKEFMPKKSKSGSYQGPRFFSYNSKPLLDIRQERTGHN